MSGLSRRGFLGKGSLTVAAAGLLASAPAGAVAALMGGAADAPTVEDDVLGDLGAGADGAVVAHIRDIGSGEIAVFTGEREVVIRDTTVTSRLLRAIK